MKKFTFEEHLASQYEVRKWWWPTKWYVEPEALAIGEWEHNDKFFKKNYPVQYFIKYKIIHNLFWVQVERIYSDVKYNIKGYFCNPRKEMRDKVFPIRWSDLTETIVQFHLQAVIEFVKNEKCFKYNVYNHSDEHKKFASELKDWFNYAYIRRPNMLNDIDIEYKNLPVDVPLAERYKKVDEIEEKMSELDKKLCIWVIENRQFFWV